MVPLERMFDSNEIPFNPSIQHDLSRWMIAILAHKTTRDGEVVKYFVLEREGRISPTIQRI